MGERGVANERCFLRYARPIGQPKSPESPIDPTSPRRCSREYPAVVPASGELIFAFLIDAVTTDAILSAKKRDYDLYALRRFCEFAKLPADALPIDLERLLPIIERIHPAHIARRGVPIETVSAKTVKNLVGRVRSIIGRYAPQSRAKRVPLTPVWRDAIARLS